jgi:hypothetical protein
MDVSVKTVEISFMALVPSKGRDSELIPRFSQIHTSPAFPYLAAGGHYVIEDWSWAHRESWQIPYFKDKLALTNLIVEIASVTASRPDIIASMELSQHMAIIVKGSTPVERGKFDLGSYCTSRGHRFHPYL